MEELVKLSNLINDAWAEISKEGDLLEIYGSIGRYKDKLAGASQLIVAESRDYLNKTPSPNYWKLLILLENFRYRDYGLEWVGGRLGSDLKNLITEIRECHERSSNPEDLKASVYFYRQINKQIEEKSETKESFREFAEEMEEIEEREEKEAKNQENLEESEKIYWGVLANDGDDSKAYQITQNFLVDNGLQRSDDLLEREDGLGDELNKNSQ
jgi:hypothetical protein